MSVTIEIPEDISATLSSQWGDVSRRTLEALAAEGYRSRVLSESQLCRMLGFESRFQVHAFLRQSGVFLQYDENDLAKDLAAHRELGLLTRCSSALRRSI